MFDVRDKVVLITGAAGGLGMTLSQAFAERGAKVILVGRSKGLKELVKEKIKVYEHEPWALVGDVNVAPRMNQVVSRVVDRLGTIDVLINNAGVNVRKKVESYTRKDWQLVMDTNLRAAFELSQKVTRIMKKNGSGRIINISSIQGVICWPVGDNVLAPYCASKAGLISLTKSFALELAAYGVTVNAVCPGVIDGKWAVNLKADKKIYKDILYRTPVGRLCTHEDLIGPVLFLASNASSFVTGQSLMVDGGWTIQ